MPRARSSSRHGSTKRPGRRLLLHDRKLERRFVAGVDEVGRGCLAGPLVAAAVTFDYRRMVGPAVAPLGHLDDSKKLTPAARERLADVIIASAAATSIVVVAPSTIDRVGLHRSNLNALCRALLRLRCPVDVALVDGFHVGDMPMECRRIVRGDGTSAAIAAASVLAKVTRDRLMCRLDAQLGGRWGFAEHMGYATGLHRDRIREHGVSDLHRRSFASTAYTDDMWAALEAGADPDDLVNGSSLVVPASQHGSEGVDDVVDAVDGARPAADDQEDVKAVAPHPPLQLG